MKSPTFSVSIDRLRWGFAWVALSASPLSFSAPAQTAATSKIFVADLQGQAKIEQGDKVTEIINKATYSPAHSAIEMEKAANLADQQRLHASMVYSNGTGIYFAPGTRLEIKTFSQEPFAPNRTDIDLEPSISDTQAYLAKGTVGLCTSKLVAGTRMVYETPHGVVNIRGRRVTIEVTDEFTRIVVLEGESTARAGKGNSLNLSGQTITAGEQAYIRKGSAGQTETLEVSPVPVDDRASLEAKVAFACLAKRTVFFDSVDGNNGTEIVPVDVVPATLPTQFTISPARIN